MSYDASSSLWDAWSGCEHSARYGGQNSCDNLTKIVACARARSSSLVLGLGLGGDMGPGRNNGGMGSLTQRATQPANSPDGSQWTFALHQARRRIAHL